MGFPGMGLFDDLNSSLNPFIEKMDKGELTLEDILKEDNIIQDIRSNNDSKFLKFFSNDKIKKLIDYSTKFPSKDEHNIGYKYPFNATEILCSEQINFQNIFMNEDSDKANQNRADKEILKEIRKGGFISELFKAINQKNGLNKKENENEEQESDDDSESEEEEENVKNDKKEANKKVVYENVDYLLSFLNESDKTKENYVLVGYFYKILNNLINIHQIKMIQYLLDYPNKKDFNVINLFIKHMNRKSMCNIIQKLLMFDDEMMPKLDEKKIDLFFNVLNELDNTEEKNKYACICDCICSVMNNRQFFDLFMTKKELLEKIYNILFKCKINDKYNSIMKLLIKINENILQHFSIRYTETTNDNNNNNNNNDLMPLNIESAYSVDKSLSSPEDNIDNLKKYLLALFDFLEKNKFEFLDDLKINNIDKNKDNEEFVSTYMEKQKKIGMKKILQTEYLKTLIDILINSFASKYHENKIEKLIIIGKDKNIFWNLHDLFFEFPFSNIFQIYYNQIMINVINENSPNSLIDAFFTENIDHKRNLIELYINKIISDIKFEFKLTNTVSFNPLFSYIITILNKIFTSQNLHVKKIIEANKDISVFNEIIGQEIVNTYTQKLLLNDNNLGGLYFDSQEEAPLQTFGPKNFLEVFQENCKIYEMYKKGEDYKTILNKKKEKKEKEKEKEEEKKENKIENTGLEYIEDLEEEGDTLFKVEKVNLKKQRDNFLASLNKPTEEVNVEEENKDLIIDNIENDGDLKIENIGRFKELWDEEEDKEEKKEDKKEDKKEEKKEEEKKEEKKEEKNDEKEKDNNENKNEEKVENQKVKNALEIKKDEQIKENEENPKV